MEEEQGSEIRKDENHALCNSAKREVWVRGQETTDVKARSLPLKG